VTAGDVIAEATAILGQPRAHFVDRAVEDAVITGAIWVHDNATHGLRVERVGDRHAMRAWAHTRNGRRAELIRYGAPTASEIRAVAVMGGLLPADADVTT
jgi:hypothetical protein